MHEANIELLRDEAQRLLHVEIDLLQKMLNEPGVIAEARAGEHQTFDRSSIPKHIEVLQGELAKLEGLEMVLAVVGTMKAGKSTAINAIVGTEVLPNRNRPMTALPTLIRHTPGQTEPLLKFSNSQPINALMGTLLAVINNPQSKEAMQGLDRNSDMDELLLLIANKTPFEQNYQGADAIFRFLKSLNDLVRLSSELGVEFPFASYDEIHEMPVIEVEFAHLREMDQAKGSLTLLDTPGPNESGQQHLRKMLKEQLSKASAVLAILDFTQLKSDADAEVRKELEEIASVSKGRMFTLVNKFDQKDRHGDSEEQVKTFVAEDLMQGFIQKADVFPVSARWGYLANRAKHEIFLHKKLPDPDKQPWVIDFAEEAFGRRWEDKISDIEDVKRSAEVLWNDSLFSKPLEHVIRSAHARAAAFAIDSSAAKLIDNAEKMEHFLGLRETALKKNANDLKRQIDSLLSDISKIENSEQQTKKRVKDTLDSLTEGTGQVFKKIQEDAVSTLSDYFKEGKRIEGEQHAKKKKDVREQGSGGVLKRLKRNILESIDYGAMHGSRKHSASDFDPEDPVMQFDDVDDAEDLMLRIQKSVDSIMQNAESNMQSAMTAVLDGFHEDFTQNIATNASKIVADMQGRMAGDGFSINVKTPNIKAISLDFSADEMLEDIISKKTKTVTRRRRQSGAWGGICKFFGTTDWGHEDYEETEKFFVVDIRKIKSAITSGIQNAFSGLDKSISAYIQKPLETGVSAFFEEFKLTVERIRGDLMQSIRDQERSKVEQDALAKRLATLKKHVPATLTDSRELKVDVEPLLANTSVPA